MKRGCLIALAIPVVAVLGFVAGYSMLYPAYTVRYRLTVNAIADGLPHSGSSVIEMRVKTQPQLVFDMPPWLFRISGEAVFVDLGNGRNLVAVLDPRPSRGSMAYMLPFKAFKIPFAVERARDLGGLQGERRLEQKDWPAFVTFRNVGDPSSVESVDPKDLAKTLGDGVRIESVIVAITQEPVTHNLAQSLPWLTAELNPQEILALSTRQISRGAFVRNDQ